MRPSPMFAAIVLAAALLPVTAHAVIVRRIPGFFNDIVYNPHDGALYASASSSDSLNPGTVVRIDPVTALITGSVAVGPEPHPLALSSDGAVLYVGLDGAGSIRRVDVASMTAGLEFSLGASPSLDSLYAEDIAVQPGNSDVVAVALRNLGFSPRHEGVAIFDHGVARANRTTDFIGSNSIAFAETPSRLYGQDGESSENGFRRMTVDANGVTVLDMTPNLAIFGTRSIEFRDGFVYTSGGSVIDAEGRTLTFQHTPEDYSFLSAVTTDTDFIYYGKFLYFGVGGAGIEILSRNSFTPIIRYTIAPYGLPTALQRWDADGLAIRTDDGALRVLTHILSPPTSDLSLTKTDVVDPVAVFNQIQYQMRIANVGEGLAENITVRDTMPPSTSYNYAFSTNGFCYDSLGVMVCSTPTLFPGDSFIVSLTVGTNATGFIANRAYVTSTTPDANPANNQDAEITEVVPQGFDQADLRATFLSLPAGVTVEGESIAYRIEVGNNGPATAHNVSFSAYAYGVPLLLEVLGGSPSCSTYFSSYQCLIGDLAPGATQQYTIRVTPLGPGYVYTSAGVFASSPDPDYSNNFVSAYVTVLPSAPHLLDSLQVAIQALGLHHGPEQDLLRQIAAARADLAARDTAAACTDLVDLQDRIARRTGRALNLDIAYSLFARTRFIQQLIGCLPSDSLPGDSLRMGTNDPGGDPMNLPGRRSLTTASSPTRLDLVLGAPGTELSPRVAMPQAGHVRLDLLDVQGRLVGTVFDGELPAGTHPLTWRGARPGSGIYFYRLLALKQQVVTKVSVVR